MTKEYFEQKKAALHRVLDLALGPATYHYRLKAKGRRPMTRFELGIDGSAIWVFGSSSVA